MSVVAVYAETDANTLNLEINIEYDPCLLKQCPGDHECRVVNHAELLEIPVAACVTRKTRPTESGQIFFQLGFIEHRSSRFGNEFH